MTEIGGISEKEKDSVSLFQDAGLRSLSVMWVGYE